MNLYKDRYLLALYDGDDELVTVLDNSADLARYLGTTPKTASCDLSRAFAGKQRTVKVGGRKCRIYFIDMEEEE